MGRAPLSLQAVGPKARRLVARDAGEAAFDRRARARKSPAILRVICGPARRSCLIRVLAKSRIFLTPLSLRWTVDSLDK
jgi:hypothetical protein